MREAKKRAYRCGNIRFRLSKKPYCRYNLNLFKGIKTRPSELPPGYLINK